MVRVALQSPKAWKKRQDQQPPLAQQVRVPVPELAWQAAVRRFAEYQSRASTICLPQSPTPQRVQ